MRREKAEVCAVSEESDFLRKTIGGTGKSYALRLALFLLGLGAVLIIDGSFLALGIDGSFAVGVALVLGGVVGTVIVLLWKP